MAKARFNTPLALALSEAMSNDRIPAQGREGSARGVSRFSCGQSEAQGRDG